MTKEIKLVRFKSDNIGKGERELTELVNAGWVIVATGGAYAIVVILQKET